MVKIKENKENNYLDKKLLGSLDQELLKYFN